MLLLDKMQEYNTIIKNCSTVDIDLLCLTRELWPFVQSKRYTNGFAEQLNFLIRSPRASNLPHASACITWSIVLHKDSSQMS